VDEFEDLFPGQRKGGSTLSVDGVEEMFAPRTPDAALSADGLSEFFEGGLAVPPETLDLATVGKIAAREEPLDAMVSSLAADLEKLAAEIAAFADNTV